MTDLQGKKFSPTRRKTKPPVQLRRASPPATGQGDLVVKDVNANDLRPKAELVHHESPTKGAEVNRNARPTVVRSWSNACREGCDVIEILPSTGVDEQDTVSHEQHGILDLSQSQNTTSQAQNTTSQAQNTTSQAQNTTSQAQNTTSQAQNTTSQAQTTCKQAPRNQKVASSASDLKEAKPTVCFMQSNTEEKASEGQKLGPAFNIHVQSTKGNTTSEKNSPTTHSDDPESALVKDAETTHTPPEQGCKPNITTQLSSESKKYVKKAKASKQKSCAPKPKPSPAITKKVDNTLQEVNVEDASAVTLRSSSLQKDVKTAHPPSKKLKTSPDVVTVVKQDLKRRSRRKGERRRTLPSPAKPAEAVEPSVDQPSGVGKDPSPDTKNKRAEGMQRRRNRGGTKMRAKRKCSRQLDRAAKSLPLPDPSGSSPSKSKQHDDTTVGTYTCDICSYSAQHESHLKTHIRTHTGERPFKCRHCKRSFIQRSGLVVHERIHTHQKPYPCQTCKRCFRTSGHLSDHFRIHTGERPYMCIQCRKTFRTSSHLSLHLKIHNNERSFACNVCGKTFIQSSQLTVHKKIHNREEEAKYKCSICSKKFLMAWTLNLHCQTVHSTGHKPHKCDRCGRAFTVKNYLTRHKKICKVDLKDRLVECTTCGKKMLKVSLRRHRLVHEGVKKYPCKVCDKSFHFAHSLVMHARVHSSEAVHSCPMCDNVFRNQIKLRRHYRVVHKVDPWEKKFKCDICQSSFYSKVVLSRHMKEVHTEDRKYKCQQCDSAFKNVRNLRQHERIHNAEAQFSCPQCPKTFSQSGNLRVHIATVHDKIKAFECAECHVTFASKRNLSTHLYTHTGEKPYKCSHCPKTFSQRGTMSRHEKIHAGDRPHVCTVCQKSFSQRIHLTKHMKQHEDGNAKPSQAAGHEVSNKELKDKKAAVTLERSTKAEPAQEGHSPGKRGRRSKADPDKKAAKRRKVNKTSMEEVTSPPSRQPRTKATPEEDLELNNIGVDQQRKTSKSEINNKECEEISGLSEPHGRDEHPVAVRSTSLSKRIKLKMYSKLDDDNNNTGGFASIVITL